MENQIVLRMLTEKAIAPVLSTTSNGTDSFTLFVSENLFVQPRKTALAQTDIAVKVSQNLCAKIIPNPSSACLGVYSVNNEYIINKDSGPLNFLLVNHTNDIIGINAGTEIAKIYIDGLFATCTAWKGGQREM